MKPCPHCGESMPDYLLRQKFCANPTCSGPGYNALVADIPEGTDPREEQGLAHHREFGYFPWVAIGISETEYWKRRYLDERISGPDKPRKAWHLFELLCRVMECPVCHDERGHAYIKVQARSLNDLGAIIGNVTRDPINQKAYECEPGARQGDEQCDRCGRWVSTDEVIKSKDETERLCGNCGGSV